MIDTQAKIHTLKVIKKGNFIYLSSPTGGSSPAEGSSLAGGTTFLEVLNMDNIQHLGLAVIDNLDVTGSASQLILTIDERNKVLGTVDSNFVIPAEGFGPAIGNGPAIEHHSQVPPRVLQFWSKLHTKILAMPAYGYVFAGVFSIFTLWLLLSGGEDHHEHHYISFKGVPEIEHVHNTYPGLDRYPLSKTILKEELLAGDPNFEGVPPYEGGPSFENVPPVIDSPVIDSPAQTIPQNPKPDSTPPTGTSVEDWFAE